jgi:hypothetical protein
LLVCCWLAGAARLAADEPLQTTTEFGITVTADELAAAIQEMEDFWGSMHAYLSGKDFTQGDESSRRQTLKFFNSVQEGFYKKLFDGGDEHVVDLVDYLSLRLRKFAMYRRLRETVDNDAVLAELVEHWERSHRDCNALPADEQAERLAKLLEQMNHEMQRLGVPDERRAEASAVWSLQADCFARMNGTEAGKMMIGFEHQARELDRPSAELIRQVANAIDWATITKPESASLTVARFKTAQGDLARMRNARVSSKPAERK